MNRGSGLISLTYGLIIYYIRHRADMILITIQLPLYIVCSESRNIQRSVRRASQPGQLFGRFQWQRKTYFLLLPFVWRRLFIRVPLYKIIV